MAKAILFYEYFLLNFRSSMFFVQIIYDNHELHSVGPNQCYIYYHFVALS